MPRKLLVILFATLVVVSLITGCTAADPFEDMFTMNIYPATTNTYDVGSLALQYQDGYFQNVYINGVLVGGGGLEIDPVFIASPAFGIAVGDKAAWDAHPGFTTGIHGVGGGDVVGTTLVQELDSKTLDTSVGKGTWTAAGVWKLPAMFFNGDITTDRWLSQPSNTFLGVDAAGADNLAHTGGAEGYSNTGIGNLALSALTTGYFNTAVGYDALASTTTGYFNSAFGTGTLLSLQDGVFNTGIGLEALAAVVTGDNNTALGMFAGYTTTGDGNVFLGYSAGKNELGSNKLYIDNSDTATPLIYGDFSTDDLTFNGDVHISAGLLDMSQIGVEPGATADRAGIYAIDLAADNCTIGFFTEKAVIAAIGVASTHKIAVRWNGTTYFLLATTVE